MLMLFVPQLGQTIPSESVRRLCGFLFGVHDLTRVIVPEGRPIKLTSHRGIVYNDDLFMLIKPVPKNPVNSVVTEAAKAELDLIHVWLAQKGLLYDVSFEVFYAEALREFSNNPDARVFKSRLVTKSFSREHKFRIRNVTERDFLEKLSNIFYLDVNVRADLAEMVLIKWVDALEKEYERRRSWNFGANKVYDKQRASEIMGVLEQMRKFPEDAIVLSVLQYLEYSAKRGHFLTSDFFQKDYYHGLLPRLDEAEKMANIMEMPNGGQALMIISKAAHSLPY